MVLKQQDVKSKEMSVMQETKVNSEIGKNTWTDLIVC